MGLECYTIEHQIALLEFDRFFDVLLERWWLSADLCLQDNGCNLQRASTCTVDRESSIT